MNDKNIHFDADKNTSLKDFLQAFFPEQSEKIHFRTFKAKNAPNIKPNAQTYEITLADLPKLEAKLRDANERHGVYFVVNSGGNSDKDIIRYNAAFMENDTLPIEQQHKNLNNAPLLPSIRVETDKSVHAYWIIDGECSEADWREIQNRLIAFFDGDKTIKNPSRAMRLPHFDHVSYDKDSQTYSHKRVEIVEFEPQRRYTAKELLEAFPEAPQTEIKTEQVTANLQNGEMPEWYEKLQEEIQRHIYSRVKDGWTFKCPAHNGQAADSAILFSNGNVFCRSKNCEPEQMARAFGIDVDAYRKKYILERTQKNKADSIGNNFMKIKEKIDSFSSLNSSNFDENEQQKKITDRALYGLAGEIVRTIEPHTEADSMALLLNTLITFGNVIGRKAFFEADGSQHFTNLYGVIVGTTSAGKGTSWSQIKQPFNAVDNDWAKTQIKSGLSSGEGLIAAVSDESKSTDKRLLIVESEFASVLGMQKREGNVLSPMIRSFWDDGTAHILNKNSPLSASNAHVSIIGHITPDELRSTFGKTQISNGFANRFLWTSIKRSKLLPNGGKMSDEEQSSLVKKLQEAVEFARTVREMKRDAEAESLWIRNYPILTAERSGAFGNATARARAQVVRLSMIYALMDKSAVIKREHLIAALAFWQFCEDSAQNIFGDSTGLDDLDKLIKSLKNAPKGKLSRTEISRDVFSGNKSASDLDLLFYLAEQRDLVEQFTEGEGKEASSFLKLIHKKYEFDEVDKLKTYTATN